MFDHLHSILLLLSLNGISSISIWAHCFLYLQWAPLKRAWCCLPYSPYQLVFLIPPWIRPLFSLWWAVPLLHTWHHKFRTEGNSLTFLDLLVLFLLTQPRVLLISFASNLHCCFMVNFWQPSNPKPDNFTELLGIKYLLNVTFLHLSLGRHPGYVSS